MIFQIIPDNSVDMTFADPPFNLKKKYNGYRDDKEFGVYLKWCKEWISEMVRITKPTGSIFVHNIPKWLACGKKAGLHPFGPLVSDVWTDIHRIIVL